jgi:hypothetical protein
MRIDTTYFAEETLAILPQFIADALGLVEIIQNENARLNAD